MLAATSTADYQRPTDRPSVESDRKTMLHIHFLIWLNLRGQFRSVPSVQPSDPCPSEAQQTTEIRCIVEQWDPPFDPSISRVVDQKARSTIDWWSCRILHILSCLFAILVCWWCPLTIPWGDFFFGGCTERNKLVAVITLLLIAISSHWNTILILLFAINYPPDDMNRNWNWP